ncbi:sensor histidine kinase [Cohnella silvisoli]|uniref:histidine kinase n=1 Tax=Cohnella silvisoli TaxID=2873699 RepID=A0ABV1KRA7_9BACL|nr:ATP-binding protein [Cohnella silvisoli]MCD9022185.1 ATP-binding protein [Cohnella silvisoli]
MTTESEINDGPIWLEADRKKLHRAISNVIDNSLKHMDKKERKLEIGLRVEGEGVEIRISDNGPGIPPDALPFVFERFYRAEPSRNSNTGGSGLGLAIVKQIIEEHGGTVTVKSTQGQGTHIYFKLPKMTSRKGETT